MATFKYRPLDSRLQHRAPAAAAMTSTTTLATVDQTVAMRTEYVTRINVEAVDVASGNELYVWVIELSDDNFVTTNEVAAIRDMGDTTVRTGGAPDTAAGDQIEMYWATEVNGIAYRYWRLRMIASGTTPSITANAYSAPMQ